MNVTFADFFRAAWGYDPYPWQSRLSDQVKVEGWPHVLDLPTGVGKTAVLDVALYDFIRDGGRHAPRRIFLVVDRRIIVDQAAHRARQLARRLEDAEVGHGPEGLQEAARVLRELVGPDVPLLASESLRGGQARVDAWARYPHVPVLAASTVDQVGSQLLFRGYGVTERARPIRAGLLGCDSLFFLDEVHLAAPFANVLRELEAIRGPASEVPRRWRTVALSATPGIAVAPERRFSLCSEDRDHPGLRPILGAAKPAKLEEVKLKGGLSESDKRAAVASRAASAAREMLAESRRSIAVIVNRVDTARRAWQELQATTEADVVLVTGRMRPLDRERILGWVEPRVLAGRTADCPEETRPVVMVATQCVEAGADFDFDGLVTECAALDALRQRFGRLDRRGQCTEWSGRQARAVVLGRTDAQTKEDPVYGSALRATWKWLQEVSVDGEVDFGIETMAALVSNRHSDDERLVREPRPAPVMMPTYLEQWAQTNPRPHADPDPALFLHGIPRPDERPAVDVRVVWRADLTEEDLAAAYADRQALARLRTRVASVPPGSLEAISLPLWLVRQWLRDGGGEDESADLLTDVEGAATPMDEAGGGGEAVVVDWRGVSRSLKKSASGGSG